MPSLEAAFESAVANKVIPGAVLVASSTDGSFQYTKTFGTRTLKDGSSSAPMDLDTVFWMGSCTKLLTSIAALQCVDKGLFTLDEDVTRLVPELKDIEVKVPPANGEGEPTMHKAKNKITLRRLMNHTSGLSYTKFGQLHLPLMDRILAPLVFEPGEGFMYGTGSDFAALMVERATGLTLEHYIQQHIAAPLGITSVCFRPPAYPDLLARLADVSYRKSTGSSVEYTADKVWPIDTQDQSGGSGLYTTIADFHKFVHSIASDDGVLLPRATSPGKGMVDDLLAPVMKPKVRADVKKVLRDVTTNNIFGGLPIGTDVTYAMGGMVCLEDLEGRRRAGTVHWGALLNIFFWMDRETGLSGIFGTQVFPAGDGECLRLFAEFEKAMYERYQSSVGGS